LAKDELGKKREDGGKMPDQGLANGVKDGLLEKTGPAEAGRKRAIQVPGHNLATGGPVEVSP
jgi:hypothetical protein